MRPFNLLSPFHSLILQMLLLKDWNSFTVGLFFPLRDGNQNKCVPFPHRTNEDSCCLIGTLTEYYSKSKPYKIYILFFLWVTKLEKHRLFTLTKSRTVAPNQMKCKHIQEKQFVSHNTTENLYGKSSWAKPPYCDLMGTEPWLRQFAVPVIHIIERNHKTVLAD